MKKILLVFSGLLFSFSMGQTMKPMAKKVQEYRNAGKSFTKFTPFAVADNAQQKQNLYKSAAEDITVLKLQKTELQRIVSEKPEAMEMSFPFENKTVTVELVKHNIFAEGFQVNTDKGYVDYTPGVYYQGIVKGDETSVVAFSFFDNDVVGVASQLNVGNMVLGKTKNSEDYVSYNDAKLTGTNPFVCGADELPENQMKQISFDPSKVDTAELLTNRCVKIYFEIGYEPYLQNGSNTTTTTNWLTAMFNNIKTLYNNDDISVALSDVFVWTSADPYSGTPNEILNQFSANMSSQSFDGDLAQLLRNPATTSIAWVNTLCAGKYYQTSYCGVNFTYESVPTYSWNIEAMTHELGHNLGSKHTHDCVWNGDNTPIDGCGYVASQGQDGCDGPIPTAVVGGTIMSYCHLLGSVGINFTNGFGPQPKALIINRVEASSCLEVGCTCLAPSASVVATTCIPPGVNNVPPPGQSYFQGPTKVQLGNINNSTDLNTLDGFYRDFTIQTCDNPSLYTTISGDSSNTISISLAPHPSNPSVLYTQQVVTIWIDYNNNGTFEDDPERIISTIQSTLTASYNFMPLADAVRDTYLRMRVKADNSTGTACGNLIYGQTEDYAVKIPCAATVTPSVSIATPQTTVCAGTLVTFTATPTNGGTTPSYQWKVNSENMGTNSATFDYIPANGDVVTCEMTSNETCLTATTATSNDVTMNITTQVAPTVSISENQNNVCVGTSVTFTATPTDGGTTPSYQWKVNSENMGTNSATFDYTPANGDVVTCEMTSNADCLTTTQATSNEVMIVVNPLPEPQIVANGNLLSTTQTYAAYQWIKDGADIPGAVADTYIATVNGNYSVRVTNADGCEGVSDVINHTYLNVSDVEKGDFEIYPNPVKDILYIQGSGFKNSRFAEIYDASGKLVKTFSGNSVNVSGLPKGTYVLKTDGQTVKFIKE
ncbi:MAG: M12 family metallo-peptidase [Flavobacteriaceae bacterium]|jgi:hypothetical protein|nr:M12 family metallo-peptidase [Flavobacteriaceae bacterium]